MAFPVDLFNLLYLEAGAIGGADNDLVTSWSDLSVANNDTGRATAETPLSDEITAFTAKWLP